MQRAKGIPGWFVVPPTKENKAALGGVPGVRFARKPVGWFEVHRTHLPLLKDVVQTPSDYEGERVDHEGIILRSYQQEAKDFILKRRGVLLGDQQRLGKTPTAISCHDPKWGPLHIFAPLYVRHVWLMWIKRRWPEAIVHVIEKRDHLEEDLQKIREAEFLFCHLELLPYWKGAHTRAGTAIVDEAHLLQNSRSQRSHSAKWLVAGARHVILTTGTPAWNRPVSVYPLLQMLAPGAWGSWPDFVKRYCNGYRGSYGWVAEGSSNEEEFQARLSEVMIRRTWNDVQDQVPEYPRSVELISVSSSDYLKIDKLTHAAREKSTRPQTQIGEDSRLRKALGLMKVKRAVEMANAATDPIVVWVWFREVGEKIHEQCPGSFLVYGDTPHKIRQTIIEDWEKTNKPLIISLAVGQAGIDLSHARDAIFADLDWTPAVLGQAEMRTFHRERPGTITYLTLDHPLEIRIVKSLLEKNQLATEAGLPASDANLEALGCLLEQHPEVNLDLLVDWMIG